MSIFDFIKGKSQRQGTPAEHRRTDRGFMVFDNTTEVIFAEKLLKKNGWAVRVMGPPPEIRQGCDLVILFPLIDELHILRTLKGERISPLKIVPVTGLLLEPVAIFQIKDYGRYLMVRAANMKLTVEKETKVIVNISGGGCPDIPFLAASMVGKTLAEAPAPHDIGHTLCGYALQLAYEEVQRQCSV